MLNTEGILFISVIALFVVLFVIQVVALGFLVKNNIKN
jgi:hypothetical protein